MIYVKTLNHVEYDLELSLKKNRRLKSTHKFITKV